MIPLHAQNQPNTTDAVSFVGLTVSELLQTFGVPLSVHASRGVEVWQDDVVFVYPEGDFYLHRDRVWQVGVKAIRGINSGDSRDKVLHTLGESARLLSGSVFFQIDHAPWPLVLRYDFDTNSRVRGIFVYRSDM